jgi:hypothetical protein
MQKRANLQEMDEFNNPCLLGMGAKERQSGQDAVEEQHAGGLAKFIPK